MAYVTIDNIDNGRIYQQQNGFADITVTGEARDRGEAKGAVYAWLTREQNGTLLTPLTRAEMTGNRYSVTLRAASGGHYTLRVKYMEEGQLDGGMNGDCRFSLGVGDLFVIAGQSNAAGFGRTPTEDAPDARISLFALNRRWRAARHPLSDGAGYDCTPLGEYTVTGSSPFIAFASAVAREVNYPIGLLQTAQGGAPISQWKKGGALYDKMVEVIRLAGGRVRGVLWYQGCSDTDRAEDAQAYFSRFEDLIDRLRSDLSAPELPFFTVQLNKFGCGEDDARNALWAAVKEAQRQAARRLEYVSIVPSHDVTMSDFVHNSASGARIIGQRMAWQALGRLYGKPYFGDAPDLSRAVVRGQTVTLRFDGVPIALDTCWLPPQRSDFVFEDALGSVPIDSYTVRGDTLEATLSRVPEGTLYCSFAAFCVPGAMLPIERATGMPPLGYYRVPAEADAGKP